MNQGVQGGSYIYQYVLCSIMGFVSLTWQTHLPSVPEAGLRGPASRTTSLLRQGRQVLDQPVPDPACQPAPEGYKAIPDRDQVDAKVGSPVCLDPDQDLAQDVGSQYRVHQLHGLPQVSVPELLSRKSMLMV
jgi:hypothetical protein